MMTFTKFYGGAFAIKFMGRVLKLNLHVVIITALLSKVERTSPPPALIVSVSTLCREPDDCFKALQYPADGNKISVKIAERLTRKYLKLN